jgi:DNA (cytosine-5)-methyltransferase 1
MYHANLANPEDTMQYFGSVNGLLVATISGQYSGLVPRPGEVDLISAGSHCQGSSNANQKRLNEGLCLYRFLPAKIHPPRGRYYHGQ